MRVNSWVIFGHLRCFIYDVRCKPVPERVHYEEGNHKSVIYLANKNEDKLLNQMLNLSWQYCNIISTIANEIYFVVNIVWNLNSNWS